MSLTSKIKDLEFFDEELLISPYNSNFDSGNHSIGLNFNHKLNNAEEFRGSAAHFEEFGVYTRNPFNRHPKSRYMQFWKEEKRRSLEGYHIGRDYITGYHYWYLNYQRVEKVKYREEDIPKLLRGEKVKAERPQGFPDIWDYDYYFYHYLEEAEKAGKHAASLKSRGKGYSFKGAGMLNRNFFLIPDSMSYVIAHEKEYLSGTDGILSRAYDSKEFVNANTGFFKYSHKKNTPINYRASKITYGANGREIELGYKSEVKGIPLKGNIGRARGKRAKLILWEEAGNFPDLLEAWKIARESVEQDSAVFGLMVAFGTSGSDPRSFNNLRELFLKPEAYGVLGLTNIWSLKPTNSKVSFFSPAYTNLSGLMDKNGNSNIELGYSIERHNLDKLREAKADPNSITQHRMERPNHPEDALLRKGINAFPVNLLKGVLANLDDERDSYDTRFIGNMGVNAEGEVIFVETTEAVEVGEYPHDTSVSNDGAVVIYRKPIMKNNKTIPGVYIAGGDPYDHDKSTTNSLGSAHIMNTVTGEIVADYTGRPSRAEEYHEQLRLLLLYYDARINHENDLIGFKTHLDSKGCNYLMVDTPDIVRSVTPNSNVDRGKGTHATTKINRFARTLIDNWLKEKIGDGELTFAHTIKSKPLIQELIDWDINGNFDRVSSLGMLLILYEDYKYKGIGSYNEDISNIAENDEVWDKL